MTAKKIGTGGSPENAGSVHGELNVGFKTNFGEILRFDSGSGRRSYFSLPIGKAAESPRGAAREGFEQRYRDGSNP